MPSSQATISYTAILESEDRYETWPILKKWRAASIEVTWHENDEEKWKSQNVPPANPKRPNTYADVYSVLYWLAAYHSKNEIFDALHWPESNALITHVWSKTIPACVPESGFHQDTKKRLSMNKRGGVNCYLIFGPISANGRPDKTQDCLAFKLFLNKSTAQIDPQTLPEGSVDITYANERSTVTSGELIFALFYGFDPYKRQIREVAEQEKIIDEIIARQQAATDSGKPGKSGDPPAVIVAPSKLPDSDGTPEQIQMEVVSSVDDEIELPNEVGETKPGLGNEESGLKAAEDPTHEPLPEKQEGVNSVSDLGKPDNDGDSPTVERGPDATDPNRQDQERDGSGAKAETPNPPDMAAGTNGVGHLPNPKSDDSKLLDEDAETKPGSDGQEITSNGRGATVSTPPDPADIEAIDDQIEGEADASLVENQPSTPHVREPGEDELDGSGSDVSNFDSKEATDDSPDTNHQRKNISGLASFVLSNKWGVRTMVMLFAYIVVWRGFLLLRNSSSPGKPKTPSGSPGQLAKQHEPASGQEQAKPQHLSGSKTNDDQALARSTAPVVPQREFQKVSGELRIDGHYPKNATVALLNVESIPPLTANPTDGTFAFALPLPVSGNVARFRIVLDEEGLECEEIKLLDGNIDISLSKEQMTKFAPSMMDTYHYVVSTHRTWLNADRVDSELWGEEPPPLSLIHDDLDPINSQRQCTLLLYLVRKATGNATLQGRRVALLKQLQKHPNQNFAILAKTMVAMDAMDLARAKRSTENIQDSINQCRDTIEQLREIKDRSPQQDGLLLKFLNDFYKLQQALEQGPSPIMIDLATAKTDYNRLIGMAEWLVQQDELNRDLSDYDVASFYFNRSHLSHRQSKVFGKSIKELRKMAPKPRAYLREAMDDWLYVLDGFEGEDGRINHQTDRNQTPLALKNREKLVGHLPYLKNQLAYFHLVVPDVITDERCIEFANSLLHPKHINRERMKTFRDVFYYLPNVDPAEAANRLMAAKSDDVEVAEKNSWIQMLRQRAVQMDQSTVE